MNNNIKKTLKSQQKKKAYEEHMFQGNSVSSVSHINGLVLKKGSCVKFDQFPDAHGIKKTSAE